MRLAIVLLPLLAVATVGCDRQSPSSEQANAAAPAVPVQKVDRTHRGEAAPDAVFTGPDGKPTSLAAFRGKPVLLNLWATWCAPCVKEMPTLDTLAGRLGDRIHVLTVSQDMDGAAKVTPFFTKAGYTHLRAWLDPDLRLSTHYGANLPTTILYDAAGNEVLRVAGEMDWSGAEASALIQEADRH